MTDPSLSFENYEVLRREDGSVFELGRGAMGVTYKAFDTDLHCHVALKVISPGILGSGDARERFLREARAAAQLRHPNIATAFRLGRAADDTHYYAMEFCEGPTLGQAVAERGPLPVYESVYIAWQVSKALVLAEEHHLLHRDIKPSNLILTERSDEGMVVKVIDFGLAKSFGDGAQSLATMSTGGFVGTAQFASPEQLEEKDLDIRSDIYSLGSCLWFMLTARAPFEGSLARVMSQTLTADPPWEMLAKLPEPLVSLVRRMIAKNRDNRQPNASALKKELEACLHMLASPETEKSDAYGPSSEAAKSDALPEKAATARLDGESFNSRFRVNNPAARDVLGLGYRASDCAGSGESVSVHAFDPSLTRVPTLRREIEARVAVAAANPHPNLLAPVAYTSGAQGLLIATPWTEGFTLLDLLKERGALAPSEVLRILDPLAHATDHAVEQKITGLDLSKGQIVAHFPNGLSNDARAQVLATPVDQWPTFEIKAGTLSLGELGTESGGSLTSMATIAPAIAYAALLAPVKVLASLACELLGAPCAGAYVAIARMSENANAVLRRAISESSVFPCAAAFVEALRTAIGHGGSSAAPLRPKTNVPKAAPPPPSRDKSRAFAVLVILATVGLAAGYWFGIHRPREREREKREADATPKPNPASESRRETSPSINDEQQKSKMAKAEKTGSADVAYEPAPGSSEHTALMDVLRKDFYSGDEAAAYLNAKGVNFRVHHLKVRGDWALISATPVDSSNKLLGEPVWDLLNRDDGWKDVRYFNALRPFASEEEAEDALEMTASTIHALWRRFPAVPHDIFPDPAKRRPGVASGAVVKAPPKAENAKLAREKRQTIEGATKELPWENSLGMRFVVVPVTARGVSAGGKKVLFSVWETRVQDYQLFATATGRPWVRAPFSQGPDHPAVRVSWLDSVAFCEWLTAKENQSEAVAPRIRYRLPTDEEWSRAAGLGDEYGNTPAMKDSMQPGYPWGDQWPPPKGAGNYDTSLHTDSFSYTSPVGSFLPNRYGLFDLGGNACEWVSDYLDETQTKRTVRGASWADGADSVMSSVRFADKPDVHFQSYGFRCVLEITPE